MEAWERVEAAESQASLSSVIVARLDDPGTAADDAEVDADEAEEAADAAAPLALAIDLQDADNAPEGAPAAAS